LDELSVIKKSGHIAGGVADGSSTIHHEEFQETLVAEIVSGGSGIDNGEDLHVT
jgi:hypothetical protein